MKRNPGKWIWVLVATVSVMGAAPYRWSASVAKHEVFLHEAVELQYVCRFDDAGTLFSIDFNPPQETPDYRLRLLKERETIEHGKRVNEYHYLLFALRPGELVLEFPVLMRKTTLASIENTVIGRDNVEELDFTDTAMHTPKVLLGVKEHHAELVGTFALTSELSSETVHAYEPLHMTVTVRGEGNLDKLRPFDLNISGVQIFSEAPEKDYRLGSKGLSGTWTQRFALVGTKPFTVPSLTLEYFDTDAKTVRTLKTASKPIDVTALYDTEALLDAPEPEASSGWEWQGSYLYYLLTFLTGWVVGKWVRFAPNRRKIDKSFAGRVKSADTKKQLAVLLVMQNDVRFHGVIEALEADGIGLAEAKSGVLKML